MGKVTSFTFNGLEINNENFNDKPDVEVSEVRRDDSYKPMYKHQKIKRKERKEKDGEIMKYNEEEIFYMNKDIHINEESYYYKILSILKTYNYISIKEIIEKLNKHNKQSVYVSVNDIFKALSPLYLGKEKIGRVSFIYFTERGKVIPLKIFYGMVLNYKNQKIKSYNKSKNKGTCLDENTLIKTTNGDVPIKDIKDEKTSSSSDEQPEAEKSEGEKNKTFDINITVNININ
ncbi:MAG: hypothetical protein ACOC1K_01200 [Nanoarchaeota archaeon]